MASTSTNNRVRLPSINELTSSTQAYIPSLSPRLKKDRLHDIPSIGSYKYPAGKPSATSNYVLGNGPHPKPLSPPTPAQHTPHQHPIPQPQQIPPPHHVQQPQQQHHLPPQQIPQQHSILPPPPPPPQQYLSPPSHFHSPPSQYPQYIPSYQHGTQIAQHIQQLSSPPPQQMQRHQGYYQPVYYQHGPTAAGTQFAVPEVINKPNNKCHRCGTTETPEWRRGPNGVRTLCNACGLFHAKLVKRKGAALAAEEVLNNKVCKGKNGRRISIKKHNTELLKNESKMPVMHQQALPVIIGGPGFPQFGIQSAMIRP